MGMNVEKGSEAGVPAVSRRTSKLFRVLVLGGAVLAAAAAGASLKGHVGPSDGAGGRAEEDGGVPGW
jgi:hypothetical protein